MLKKKKKKTKFMLYYFSQISNRLWGWGEEARSQGLWDLSFLNQRLNPGPSAVKALF